MQFDLHIIIIIVMMMMMMMMMVMMMMMMMTVMMMRMVVRVFNLSLKLPGFISFLLRQAYESIKEFVDYAKKSDDVTVLAGGKCDDR